MSIRILRGKSDDVLKQIIKTLDRFQTDHPKAEIDVYRQNQVSVRIRIVDSDFNGVTKPERNKAVWSYLNALAEDVQGDISMLVLLSPKEKRDSLANLEFEDPVRALGP